MVCKILEAHADAEAEQWCVVMEPAVHEKGGECLEALLRKGPLDKGKIRQAFIRTARAVQSLHRAGLVHNAISPHNILACKSGFKLGNFSGLQRQSEELRRHAGSRCSPERALAEHTGQTLKCDFATDVWCLGLLLHELASGVVWDAGREGEELAEELLKGEVRPSSLLLLLSACSRMQRSLSPLFAL